MTLPDETSALSIRRHTSPAANPGNRYTAQRGFVLSGLPLRIATCESGDLHGSYRWDDPPNSAGASGAFQFIISTWRAVTHRHDQAYQAPPAVQLAAFYVLWDHGRGARNWDSSRPCWG